jgi:two-component system CheB/CheR fusion protein
VVWSSSVSEAEVQDSTRVVLLIGEDAAAAEQVVRGIPVDPGFALVVALQDGSGASNSLKAATSLPTSEVTGNTPVAPGRMYLVNDPRGITFADGHLVVSDPPPTGALDRMLRSLADQRGANATVVVLGGTVADGTLGIRRMREAGGLTICQRTSDDGAMSELPHTAIVSGNVDLVLPVDEIAERVVSLAKADPIARAATDMVMGREDLLQEILAMIRIRTGHDFSWYKRATLLRRLARRMQVCATESLSDYHRVLREQPAELGNLLRDFLISVTNFFRDPEAFDALAETVIPRLFRGKDHTDQVRVWVAGCATGEEAYSIAMLLSEYAMSLPAPPQLQVFATDIDEEALAEARAGIYPTQIATDVTAARLQRFFVYENDHFRVCKELREMILFSPHNVLRDPPFSRLDLVSCRNLLIYLNREAQNRVINTFHFALRHDGYLLLGSSESAEGMQQFSPTDAKNRIFERRIAPSAIATEAFVTAPRFLPTRTPSATSSGDSKPIGTFGELHHRAVEMYAPPSVLVNEDLDIVHLSENANKFLSFAGGEPSRQILRLVHPALRFELRGALYAARQPENRGSVTRVVRFSEDGKQRAIEIRVRSVNIAEAGPATLLVMFDELDRAPEAAAHADASGHIEPVVREMEEELQRLREQLRTTIEQYETSLEELKASNEELHAINEELRSATEELETSKEELQSLNEELTTLTHELKHKVDELSRTNGDLQNLMSSTDIGVLFLDRQMSIKRFTPRIQQVFNLIPSDIGRPLEHITHRLDYADLAKAARQVIAELRTVDREVTSSEGKRYLVRMLPYRSLDDRIEGVVVTFVDVTDLKVAQTARARSEAALRTSEQRLAHALAAAPLAVISHDTRLTPTWAFINGNEVEASRAPGQIFAGDDADRYARTVQAVYASGRAERIELAVATEGGIRTYDFRIDATREGHLVTGIVAVGFDITPSKAAEAALRESDRHKDEFLAMLSHELRNPLTPLRVAFDVARLARQDPEQLDAALSLMDDQLNVMVRLVDDLLDLSRLSQGKLQLSVRRIDPVTIVEAALQSTRPLIDTHHHTIDVQLDGQGAMVLGDSTRLTQVLTNLLSNAAKYTPERGKLALSMAVDAARNRLVFTMRDNGIGIAPHVLPHVFELFMQARGGEERRAGGLGVGLNVVRRVVELHGGCVAAESDGPGLGSTFRVELPLAPPET